MGSVERVRECTPTQLVWHGRAYGMTGYAKVTREILKRLTIPVRLDTGGFAEANQMDPRDRAWLDRLKDVQVGAGAPEVRHFPPIEERGPWKRRRICFTMTESLVPARKFALLLNAFYDEVWTPSLWNVESFRQGGVTRPIRRVPLGVDPEIFRPDGPAAMPPCRLLTTDRAGVLEAPQGFLYVNLCQPLPRKGLPVLLEAFERAFAADRDAALVLASTVHDPGTYEVLQWVRHHARRARVYVLEGRLTEQELAGMYRACKVYVTATHGEGWDLPLQEAAACGCLVVAPLHTAHLDYLTEENALVFEPDGREVIPAAGASSLWYKDVPFARFAERARRRLVELLLRAKQGYADESVRGRRLGQLVRTEFTWERTAASVLEGVGACV